MKVPTSWLVPVLAALVLAGSPCRAELPPFEWKDGDRVVVIGDTLIERDQKDGYLETRLTAANPDKTLTFRNLGWSGDTVFGHARARFGTPADGFQHLTEHVLALRPTVLIVGYGMVESFEGEAGLPAFVSGLNTLLDAVTATRPRLILLSPLAHEDRGRPLPDPARHNVALLRYVAAIKKIADERSAWFVDLNEPTVSAHTYGLDPLTDNGIHPTAYGHWYLDAIIDNDLRRVRKAPAWSLQVDRDRTLKANLAKATGLETNGTGLRFELTDATLPAPPLPFDAPADAASLVSARTVRIAGLAPGRSTLTIDGQVVATADAAQWSRGVRIDRGPDFEQVEALRRAIVAKNALYFYRWRPQNETYLFGFRKHEQGNNAAEIPRFDPLVEAKEAEIARLRRPVKRVYEWRPAVEPDAR